ncbi:uncharacterized protein SAPINGB_P002822 [Magnusiomyces paraingens]|uniref:Cleavage and polyadenylation specificity factor subunit 2 n=1 Tax=Magnusiomyces paraingens TaxID=2606893 RepID=A0A5E8BPB6_9ASCO|nr:uncharacterized protein SAPINGB_P002822 [Saprochaete ingens]VVT50613.1 unnamed protein product [Saprochaete ingens]
MFSFTRLQPTSPENRAMAGPKSESLAQEINQSLLSFPPDFTLLVDVGWDPALSMDLTHLITAAPTIDAILLTHATLSHLGAYAYLCKMSTEFNNVPVYSTLPVINMGRMITLESYRSKGFLGPFLDEKITLEDVEAAFDKIIPLKYSQTVTLDPNAKMLTSASKTETEKPKKKKDSALANINLSGSVQITPFNAGHTLGGTIWKIAKDQEVIIYSVDWNHSRDSHLNGAFVQQDNLIEALAKPSLMICGTKLSQISSTLKKRKLSLFRNIRETIEAGGTVLIPTSTGSRVLELVHILDAYWEEEKISAPLLYFSHVGNRTLSYASSMLEWMSSTLIDEWQVQNNSPFDAKHLKVMSSIDELEKLDGPKVVLASGEAMEVGFSRQLFSKICSQDSSMVILTERCGPETLAGQLFDLWTEERLVSDDPQNSSSKYLPAHLTTQLNLDLDTEKALAGEELVDYLEKVQEKKKNQELQSAIELRNKNILEQETTELSDDDDDEDEDEMIMSGQMDVSILLYGKDVYDYDVRTMPKSKPRMFPFAIKRRRVDDYGEVLKLDQFSKIAEKEEAEKAAALSGPAPIVPSNNKKKDESEKTTSLSTNTQYNDETFRLDSFSTIAKPTKIIPKSAVLKVLCHLDFIDFDGVTDARSLRIILQQVEPRQLIFLPSSLDIRNPRVSQKAQPSSTNVDEIVSEYEQAAAEMKLELITKAPTNEAIITQIGSNSYSLIISPELEKVLKWQKITGDYSVAQVMGKLEVTKLENTEQTQPQKEGEVKTKEEKISSESSTSESNNEPNNEPLKIEKDAPLAIKTEDSEDTLELTRVALNNGLPSHLVRNQPKSVVRLVPLQSTDDIVLARAHVTGPVTVGDIRLAELKRQLVALGHRAEFKAEGILVCDNKVAVRKLTQGNIVVEGGIGPEFYKVKGIIRSMLAYV